MNDMMMKKKGPRGLKDGIFTEDSGLPPPQDIDGGSAPKPKPKPGKPKAFAKGGVTRGDGCVAKGHTKGKMVKMAYGGKTC
jgi:hypothetical protein